MKRILLAIAVGILFPFALAAQAIDFTKPLVGLDGKALNGPTGKELTLSDVAVTALQMNLQGDQALSGAKKFELYDLSRKVYKCKSCILPVEQKALLKERIAEAYGPGVIGPAWEAIDPSVKKE